MGRQEGAAQIVPIPAEDPIAAHRAQVHRLLSRGAARNSTTRPWPTTRRPSGWPENHEFKNGLAWIHATCPDARYRDGKKAVVLATKSCEPSQWKNACDLNILAAACAESGDFESAVKWETRAIELGGDDKQEQELRLELYRERKPYHETGGWGQLDGPSRRQAPAPAFSSVAPCRIAG